jgi:hypothetical protein
MVRMIPFVLFELPFTFHKRRRVFLHLFANPWMIFKVVLQSWVFANEVGIIYQIWVPIQILGNLWMIVQKLVKALYLTASGVMIALAALESMLTIHKAPRILLELFPNARVIFWELSQSRVALQKSWVIHQ